MKISIVTMPNVYNCGASLQVFALQEYLKTLGFEVDILNYQPEYLRHYNIWRISEKYNKFLLKFLYYGVKIPKRIYSKNFDVKKKQFDSFTSKYLNIGQKKYLTNEELLDENISSDIWIVGSDLVWNPELNNGKDPTFFLNFVRIGKKISYAASIGTRKYTDEKFLRDFDGVSVREKLSVSDLEKYNIKSEYVLDPVILQGSIFWEQYITKNKNDYVFVYDFENSELINEIVLDIKKRIVRYGDNKKYSPFDFVENIYNSSIVFTNSFHAMLFSVLFHKNFYVIGRKEHDINLRMKDFLDNIGLKDHFISSKEEINNSQIDWTKIDNYINNKIEDSKRFLIKNLNWRDN